MALAMTQSISVAGARFFFERFYAELARGASAAEAVTSARRALADDTRLPTWEWAVPALYTRADADPVLRFTPSALGSASVKETPPRPPLSPYMTREQLFAGRRSELVAVARGIDPKRDGRVTLLHGEGGMGKTAIAIEAVHRWGGWFDQVIWLSARDVAAPAEIAPHTVGQARTAGTAVESEFLIALGRELGLELHGDEPPEVALPLVLDGLKARRHVLLILDNFETLAVAPHAQELLMHLPENARALVTSRRELNVNETVVAVRQMFPKDAAELLGAYARQKGLLLTTESATAIYRHTGGHPMTMRLVIAQVTSGRATLANALDDLRAARGEVFAYVFKRSLELAGAPAMRVFALSALFTPFARRDALDAASGLSDAEFGAALAHAIALSLVESYANGQTLRLQELARAQANAVLAALAESDVAAAQLRAAAFLAQFAYTMNNLLRPVSRREFAKQMLAQTKGQSLEEVERGLTQMALAAFDAERANLLAAVQWAFDGKAWNLAGTLVANQHEWQDIRAFWAERERNDLLAVEAAKREGNRAAEGIALNNLGVVYQLQGRWAEAIAAYEQDLAICRELGDRHGEGATLNNLGVVYEKQGRWAEAIAAYEQDLAICRELGDRHGEAQTLNNLGVVYEKQGRWAEAIAAYEQSLRIKRELGDQHGEGQTLNNLGGVYQLQGRWAEAVGAYEQSLRIKRELGDRHGEATTLNNLGVVYRQQGHWAEAIGAYEQDLAICRELGDRHGEGQTLNNLGVVYEKQGRWAEAIAAYEQSLQVYRELGDRHGEGQTLANIGLLFQKQGQKDKAVACWRDALTKLHPDSPEYKTVAGWV